MLDAELSLLLEELDVELTLLLDELLTLDAELNLLLEELLTRLLEDELTALETELAILLLDELAALDTELTLLLEELATLLEELELTMDEAALERLLFTDAWLDDDISITPCALELTLIWLDELERLLALEMTLLTLGLASIGFDETLLALLFDVALLGEMDDTIDELLLGSGVSGLFALTAVLPAPAAPPPPPQADNASENTAAQIDSLMWVNAKGDIRIHLKNSGAASFKNRSSLVLIF